MSEPILLSDPRHQRFADYLLENVSPAKAYIQAGYKVKTSGSAATCATRLLKNEQIKQYLHDRRSQIAVAVNFSKEDAIKMIVDIVKSRPDEASLKNPLCEIRHGALGPVAVFPSKSKMLDRLAKLMAWDAPEKVEVEGVQELAMALASMKNSG